MVQPIFYGVYPSDVCHQRANFAEAFTKHEERLQGSDNAEKVKQWRDALTKVADLSGWASMNWKSERELVKDIVEVVFSDLQHMESEFAMPIGYFEAFGATTQAMDALMKTLADEKVTAVGVYGLGGVGKTSMVKHVGSIVWNNGMFHHVITAVISRGPDLRKIQHTLADMLGFKFEEETESGRSRRLMQTIRRGKRILIILDDIWERLDLSSIGIPSYYELQRCNSKVLLTTRRLHVCHTMHCQADIPLLILSEEDAWNLFVKKARKSFGKFTDFYDVARKVARECNGLPVALIAVARALGDKDFGEWEKAARRLNRLVMPQHANPLEDLGDVFKCIKLSYDYLRSDDAKSCFLLCCLFPENYDIQIEDLLKYGMGIGLFQDSNTIVEARAAAHLVVNYLKACSLLLDTEHDGCVRMHGVIRDVAILISLLEDGSRIFVKAGGELTEWPKIHAHEGYSQSH